MTLKYSCIDSFSGAGGLSLGLKRAGFEIILGFDNDTVAIETQRANPKYLDHQVLHADVWEIINGRLFEKSDIESGRLFLLAGGPPCQGFSIQRVGEDEDIRNDLVLAYIEMVRLLKPEYFLMENVPGITGKRGKRVLQLAISSAEDIGYWVHKATLDAQDYGVPQRRRRVFVVGERKNGGLPIFQFPAPVQSRNFTVRDAIGHLPPPPHNGADHPDYQGHRRDDLSDLNIRRLQALRQGQGRDHLPNELLADCHKVSSSVVGHRNVYGRMAWDEVAPTITARFDSFTRGQFGHPEQNRSISLREGAILQTFPEDFLFCGTKVEIARQIGNAVPPKLAEEIGRQIIKTHEIKKKVASDQ